MGGNFTNVGGHVLRNLARLNANGSVESLATFNIGTGPDNEVESLALQGDGKIVIAGPFANVNGQPRNRLARLNPNGSLESQATFASGTGADGRVDSVIVQQDGGVLAGGIFTHFNGVARQRLTRLSNDAVTEALTVSDNTRLKWIRTGPAPEVEQVTFELSTNGGNWNPLGTAARIAGGWECTGLNLPTDGLIRWRGRTVGGSYCGSSGVVERISELPPPFQKWTLNHLADANAPASGDPDRDGLPSLIEYAL